MVPWLARILSENAAFSFLRVGEYITVRAACALVVAFLISITFGDRTINWLRRLKIGQQVRDSKGENAISLLDMHASKVGVPTMGGILMIGSILGAVILLGDWSRPVLGLALAMALGFAAIGFVDDYRKMVHKNSDGLSARKKLLAQASLAAIFAILYLTVYKGLLTYQHAGLSGGDVIVFPFVKDWAFSLGIWYIPFAILVLAGTSNAVNLTDGLDGLATGVTISATLCFCLVAYMAGRADASAYLIIPHVRGGGELAVLMAAVIGSCFGFLWFNSPPARVFMGDTGSMMLGGVLGAVALLLKQEFLLLIVGGVFVLEALSVIIQVSVYRWKKRRVFLMTPIHHHFERAGIPESQIIVRFWIVSALFALAGLSTLKLR